MPRPLTLTEIGMELQAWEDSADTILFPQDDDVVIDEDSGDEKEANILHLLSRILRSQGVSVPTLKMQLDMGLGTSDILALHSRLPPELGICIPVIFCDLPLLRYLREKMVGGTCTVRENWLENRKKIAKI
ncbi:hypothetical protein HHI36_018465 [Cryptolaemus montrouzieri]|uniref:Uncharacterized protein n=1 Tax=Cryptolaemus montrouzieri TaxID=559131 RepID=A0ABD2P0X5_9CUCU